MDRTVSKHVFVSNIILGGALFQVKHVSVSINLGGTLFQVKHVSVSYLGGALFQVPTL